MKVRSTPSGKHHQEDNFSQGEFSLASAGCDFAPAQRV
jgi:hypothetical protein